MLDENIVTVSPSTTYRVLLEVGMLGQRMFGPSKKATGSSNRSISMNTGISTFPIFLTPNDRMLHARRLQPS